MAHRTIEELKRSQAALVETYRTRLDAPWPGGAPGPTIPQTALQWGRVTQIVTSDETYGPHLVVKGQMYTGSPPTLANAPAATMRCYPAPGKVVRDYAVNDYVHLTPTAAALIAEPIA